MDISYIPMARGFVYLTAGIDWYSRRVLAWRVSISMDTEFCIEAVEQAIMKHGTPEIFNTDQGSQFTSSAFTGLLIAHGIRISMDGKGCWRDNVWLASTILATVLPHEGMLPAGRLSFWLSICPVQFNDRRLWACGRRLRQWATQAAQRRVVHGRSRCAAGASSTCP